MGPATRAAAGGSARPSGRAGSGRSRRPPPSDRANGEPPGDEEQGSQHEEGAEGSRDDQQHPQVVHPQLPLGDARSGVVPGGFDQDRTSRSPSTLKPASVTYQSRTSPPCRHASADDEHRRRIVGHPPWRRPSATAGARAPRPVDKRRRLAKGHGHPTARRVAARASASVQVVRRRSDSQVETTRRDACRRTRGRARCRSRTKIAPTEYRAEQSQPPGVAAPERELRREGRVVD